MAIHNIVEDSIWISTGHKHFKTLRRITKVRLNTVTVEAIGPRVPKRHRGRPYTIDIPAFLRGHMLVKQSR